MQQQYKGVRNCNGKTLPIANSMEVLPNDKILFYLFYFILFPPPKLCDLAKLEIINKKT